MADTVEFHGPLFEGGEWDHLMDDFKHDAAFDIADEGLQDLRGNMVSTYKVPTGAYEHTVHTERIPEGAVIDGEGKVYAWWLEGLGSRNTPNSRFPGYWLWLKEYERMLDKAPEIADAARDAFVARVNA